MKKIYLVLTIIGFILPSIFVFQESIETGNFLLYINPSATFNGMFANRISTAFGIDLIFAVLVFFIWTYQENKGLKLKNLWLVWLLTMLLGLAGGFPMFLYLRKKQQDD